MNNPVVNALIPVVFLIAIGFITGRVGWIGPGSVRDLSNLVFLVLVPASLFRSMSGVHIEQLEFRPILIYFAAAIVLFFGVVATQGWDRRATVLGLAAIFSNTVAIGLPLVSLAYGPAGNVLMVTLVSLHAVVLLTLATVVLELMVLREQAREGGGPQRHPLQAVALAIRNAVIHPVPLPILAGLLFAQTGWVIPDVIDKPLQLLGAAFGPLALVLVGVTLSHNPVGAQIRPALALSLAKNFIHPVLMGGFGWLMGLRGLPLAVMTMAAALPIGANVFLFSQRYQVGEGPITAAVVVSTALALVSLTVVMAILPGG